MQQTLMNASLLHNCDRVQLTHLPLPLCMLLAHDACELLSDLYVAMSHQCPSCINACVVAGDSRVPGVHTRAGQRPEHAPARVQLPGPEAWQPLVPVR